MEVVSMAKLKKKVVVSSEVVNEVELQRGEHDTHMAAQAEIHNMDPRTMMQFPGNEKEDEDKPSVKDNMIADHAFRIGGKRRFFSDALSRALGSDLYLLAVDKAWAPNPLGKGPNINVRFTREFPKLFILFDKFGVEPKEEILKYKRGLANKNGFKYLYECPSKALTHDRLNELMTAQEDIIHPSIPEGKKLAEIARKEGKKKKIIRDKAWEIKKKRREAIRAVHLRK